MENLITYQCVLDKSLVKKFIIALTLAEEDESEVVSRLMGQYICGKFKDEVDEIMKNVSIKMKQKKDNHGKAINRIPNWAFNPEQNNHKILKAFFKAENNGVAEKEKMFELCSDKNSNMYVRNFNNNFASMNTDGGKSHGKVFEGVGNSKVMLWEEVKEVVLKYRSYFED